MIVSNSGKIPKFCGRHIWKPPWHEILFEFISSNLINPQLTAYAQEWADKLAREDSFEHRQNNTYGENLYSSWSSNPKAKVSVTYGTC